MTYSDFDPSMYVPLLGQPLALSVAGASCDVQRYMWRPDFVEMAGSCAQRSLGVTLSMAYQDNATFCSKYELVNRGAGTQRLSFHGTVKGAAPVARLDYRRKCLRFSSAPRGGDRPSAVAGGGRDTLSVFGFKVDEALDQIRKVFIDGKLQHESRQFFDDGAEYLCATSAASA